MPSKQSQDNISKNGAKKLYKPFITEKQLQDMVRKAAILTGWRYYHSWLSIRSPKGFPDCLLIHPKRHRMIVAELKSDTGNPTAEQLEWLDAFRTIAGVKVCVVRPSDFDAFWEELKRE